MNNTKETKLAKTIKKNENEHAFCKKWKAHAQTNTINNKENIN